MSRVLELNKCMFYYVICITVYARCSFPCPRQTTGRWAGILGPEAGGVSVFSCNHSAELIVEDTGLIIECFVGSGAFIVQR